MGLFAGTVALAAEKVEVVVRGLEGEALQNVKAALTLPAGLVREGEVDRRWLDRFRRQAAERAQEALQPFGYYRAEIDITVESVDPGGYRFIVEVSPGQPVRVSSVLVEVEGPGEGRGALQKLAQEFPLQAGDVLNHQLYEAGKGALEAKATDLGYLDANFTVHEIRVHLAESRAEIALVLETGPRYRFGEARLDGAPEYPERFLRRYLAFSPGDHFSFSKLGQTQLNFLDSDRFREVVITPQREAASDLAVPVEVRLEPSLPKRLRPGIGYGTDTGARVALTYRDLNLRHLGHEFQAEILAAELKQSVGVAYIIPGYRNVDSRTALRLGFDRENLEVYDNRTTFAEIERIRAFGRGRQGSIYLRLQHDDFTIGDENTTSRLVLPGVRFSRRRYLDPVRPQEGYQFNLEGRGTHQMIGSDTGLAQMLASGSLLLPLPGRFSLFTRLNSGITLQNEPLREIPPTLRFFAGGDRSVRGYAYQSVGVLDDEGNVVGGKNLLVGSVEIILNLWEKWGVAVFYDAGDAFNSFTSIDWRQGAGVGLRWYTPVGPINIDLARQIGEPDPSLRLHVSLGFGW